MEYWLLFWQDAAGEATHQQIGGRLQRGDWQCVHPSPNLAEFRRDVIASDPDWTSLRVLPRPDSDAPPDRYLALVFAAPPEPDEVRDLRYVAARNQLTMFDPQAAHHPGQAG